MAQSSPASLWDKAVESLSDEDKRAIDFSRIDRPAVLADVLKAAEQKKQLCMQKRWKYTKNNGDVVIVRDLCEKMIKWAHKFKEIGDIAVQYDPTHASLPWAGVRFFLQLSVNDVEIFTAMAEGLETVSSHITRGQLYEQLYQARPSSAKSEMESSLLRLYTAILEYLARARHFYDKSTLRRLGASVIHTSNSIEACLAKVAVERDDVERCVRLIDGELLRGIDGTITQTQTSVNALADDLKSLTTNTATANESWYQSLKAILASFEQPILRTATQLSDIHASLKKTERREILSWLSTVRYREHHKALFSAVMPGSGSWLQEKLEFIDWKSSSSSSILWVHGIPGSGKSKLMSTVVQGLLEGKSQRMATSAVAYFYCARDAAETQRADPDEIMRAVLKQLSCFDSSQPIHPAVLREYEERQKDADEDGSDPSRLSLRDCKDLILEITDLHPIIVMIDALDECDPRRRHELLQALRDIVRNSNSLVKIIVSSRDDSDIVCRLNNVPNVYIRSDDNGDDVDRFIEQEVDQAIEQQRLLQGRVPASLRQRILDELRSRAHGMFLWASLQIQNLCDPECMLVASDIEEALHKLPPTLSQLYSVILDRIDRIASHGRLLATKTLRWLLCARTPLTSKTLIEILEPSEPDSRLLVHEVLSLCCNLVIWDETLDVFRFAHASVREFLESLPRFAFKDINLQAAQECFHMLVYSRTTSRGNFAEYAVAFWVDHYRDLDVQFRVGQPLANEVKDFFIRGLHGDDKFATWHHWVNSGRPIIQASSENSDVIGLHAGSAFHLACMYGLPEVVEAMVEYQDLNINSTDFIGVTGLYLAACNGYLDIAVWLLAKGADPNVRTIRQETALHRAAEIGPEAVALVLLQHGADVAAHDDQGWTALDWAVKWDREGMIRLLILNGADSEAMQKYGPPLIDWARASPSRDQIEVLHFLHRATGCIGIRNEGQTGYLNAILHFLYSIQPFHDLLKKLPQDEDGTHPTIAGAIERLFGEMTLSEEVVSTRELTIAFGWESEQLQQPNDPFELFTQLMYFFLDHVQRDFVQELWGDSLHKAYKELFWSEITDLHGFRSGERTMCLDLFANGNKTLEQAWQKFASDDDGPPRWRLSYSPSVLVFELKRFRYNMNTNSIEKASRLIPILPNYPALSPSNSQSSH
ncbi:MAG: hypothetical protein Q9166_006451 [cf. Caloplaca sp. 2 TL-2023]